MLSWAKDMPAWRRASWRATGRSSVLVGLSLSMGVKADVLDVMRRSDGVTAGRGVSGMRFVAAAWTCANACWNSSLFCVLVVTVLRRLPM